MSAVGFGGGCNGYNSGVNPIPNQQPPQPSVNPDQQPPISFGPGPNGASPFDPNKSLSLTA